MSSGRWSSSSRAKRAGIRAQREIARARQRATSPLLRRAHRDALIVTTVVLVPLVLILVPAWDNPVNHDGRVCVLLVAGALVSAFAVLRRDRLTRRLIDAGRSGRPLCGACLHPLPIAIDGRASDVETRRESSCSDHCVECGAVYDRGLMISWVRSIESADTRSPADLASAIISGRWTRDMWPGGLLRLDFTPGLVVQIVLSVATVVVWLFVRPLVLQYHLASTTGVLTSDAVDSFMLLHRLAGYSIALAFVRAFTWYERVPGITPPLPPGPIGASKGWRLEGDPEE